MNVEAYGIRDQLQGLVEEEKALPGEAGIEPAARVQGPDLRRRKFADTSVAVAGAVYGAVVDDDEPAVGAAMHVEFDALHPKTDRLGESRLRVLRVGAGCASVCDHRRR